MSQKILLVDDEPDIVELIPMLDKNKDREYVVCTDPLAALDKIVQGGFDIVLCDVSMARLDGIKLVRQVREMSVSVPFILFTGCILEDIEPQIKEIEHCSVFSKTDILKLFNFLSERLSVAR